MYYAHGCFMPFSQVCSFHINWLFSRRWFPWRRAFSNRLTHNNWPKLLPTRYMENLSWIRPRKPLAFKKKNVFVFRRLSTRTFAKDCLIVLGVKGKIIRWQKAALKCTKRKLRASTHPIFIVLIHGRPVGEVRGFLLYAGQEKWIIYYRSGWNKFSLLCRWVPRVRGDETNWLINKKNKTSALTASLSGNSIETWVSCRLIRAGWKISWRVTWFSESVSSPAHSSYGKNVNKWNALIRKVFSTFEPKM